MSCNHFSFCVHPGTRTRQLVAVAGIALCAHMTAVAEEKPLWEAGLGVAAMRIPAYRGSDQSSNLVLPLPYFVYRGEFLKADRNGVRGQLFESEDVDLTVSAALSPPASSRKIRARAGMPDLDANFEIGPQVDFSLWRNTRHSQQLKFQMPVRAAFTLDRRPQNIGWVAHPRLNLDMTDLPGLAGWNFGFQSGPLFGDRRQHAYFYGVDAAHATVDRPAYRARGGYSGMEYLLGVSRRFPGHWLGAFVRYDNLQNARFSDSPLVRTRHYFVVGMAVSWILGESSTRVAADD